MLHHQTTVTSLSGKLPPQPQLTVEVAVLPVQLLLQLMSSLEMRINKINI